MLQHVDNKNPFSTYIPPVNPVGGRQSGATGTTSGPQSSDDLQARLAQHDKRDRSPEIAGSGLRHVAFA